MQHESTAPQRIALASPMRSTATAESGASSSLLCPYEGQEEIVDDRPDAFGFQRLEGCVGETREEVRMIIADLAVDGLDRDAWHSWQHPDGIVSLCPLPSTDLFQYAATIAPGADSGLALTLVQTILERRTGRTDIRLHEPEWSSLWRANIRLVDRYREGNVFLAGDAAHIHSPAGGQGMNTGIQDAYNLGWKLAAVANGAASLGLLATYEAERRPVAAHVLELSNARLEQALGDNAVPTRRDASTFHLDVGYRGSALARDDRDDEAPLRAGDRAPDATKLVSRPADISEHNGLFGESVGMQRD